jgi:hypothetical protein
MMRTVSLREENAKPMVVKLASIGDTEQVAAKKTIGLGLGGG